MKLRRVGALVALGTAFWTAAPVAAEPPAPPAPPDGGAVAVAPVLSLNELSSSNSSSFVVNRNVASGTLTFPVSPGLVPAALKADIELPVNLSFGNIVVSQGERTIAIAPLPAPGQPQIVDVPLAGVQIFDNWVTLKMTVNVVPIENYCWDKMAPIRLTNGAIAFTGAELPPTSIASFLPPVLRKVTIAVPAVPSRAESNAAVQVAAAVSNRNGQRPEVVVVPLPDGASSLPAPSAPLERQIIVKEGLQKGLSLQGAGVPSLLISGAPDELAGQAQLFDDDALKLAGGPTAVADSLPDQKLADDNTTLEQLTGSGQTAEQLWPDISIDIDQTRWGHPVSGLSMHLIGTYTPLPTNFAGEVTVSIGNDTVARWPADATGTIDQTVTIPNRLLKRMTSIVVGVRSTGNPGNCGDHLPMVLRLDGSTGITLHRADPPVPQGFQSLPQSLMPRIRIGIGADAFGDTARAAQIMVGLQRASAVPLITDVTGLQQAIDSKDPAILVSAGGWDNKAVALPFSAEQGRVTVAGVNGIDQPVTLNLDPATPFGSLQTVFDGRRTVLVATTTGDPALLDGLLGYLAAEPGRWTGLAGRALIAVPGSEPVAIPNPPINYSADQSGQSDQGGWFWWAVGGVAALAALGAVAILLRARHS